VIRSVHTWGFFDDDGKPRRPDKSAPSRMTVHEHHVQVISNITRHGGTITELRTTRTLGGWLVGTEFVAPAHDQTAAMWHTITEPAEVWPA
jgi:hypothetical protein